MFVMFTVFVEIAAVINLRTMNSLITCDAPKNVQRIPARLLMV